MNYTLPKLAKELNCDKSKIINCIKYLQIKESGFLKKNTPYYNENDLLKIKNLIENNDTRKLFYSLKMQEKYGVDNYFERNDLIRKSMIKKYGVDNPMESSIIKEKVINNWKNKTQKEKDELTLKTKKTKLEKYGNENFNNSDKMKSTMINRYGKDSYAKTSEFKIKIHESWKNKTEDELKIMMKNRKKQDIELANEKRKETRLKKLELIPSNYISIQELSKSINKDDSHLREICKKLNIEMKVFNNLFRFYIDKSDVSKIENYFKLTIMSGKSHTEKEILNFIKSIYDGEIIENSKAIISPKELDIYIPSKKIAIEYDGLYWHNELRLENDYHLNKTNACNSKGIDLIHVFEDDWSNHKEIVKSMIASRLGIYERKIFARKCEIKTVDKDICKKFFNANHLQGFAKGDIYLGLFYQNELVQAIIINKKGWHDGNVELTRMATKLNIQVIGGFSKLMNHLVTDYNFKSVVSYVYKSWFNGKGYLASGFEIVKENKPSYSYIVNDERVHKSKFRKEKIKKLYEDGILEYWNENESEHENMLKNKIYRIYDCGTVKVEYKI